MAEAAREAARETEQEVLTAESGTLAVITKAEIDVQIATARQYPRSIKRFRTEMMDMVTLTEKIAEECIYALPRDGKTIEGPSARFAEVAASAWGNCRAGARTVSEENDFVVAQGVFHDLERNVAITYEVKRRIVNKYGKRFGADMIGVTANAACSIALRNAILKGIPKAFWSEMYDAARKAAIGDVKTLANKRAEMMLYFQKMGVTPEMIFSVLSVAGVEDIGMDELVTLKGMATAIKEGDTTVEQAFPMPPKEDKGKGVAGLKETLGVGDQKKDPPPTTTEPEKKDSTSGSASKDEGKPEAGTTEREPGADEGEDGLPFGKTEKAPTDSAEVPAYLNRAASLEDLSVRWDACKDVIGKCSPMMKKAYEKHREEREKALRGGTK
jgi:hypothetical protein